MLLHETMKHYNYLYQYVYTHSLYSNIILSHAQANSPLVDLLHINADLISLIVICKNLARSVIGTPDKGLSDDFISLKLTFFFTITSLLLIILPRS